MANAEDIATTRRMADEPTPTTYTDDAILALLAQHGSPAAVAEAIWQDKAAKYAKLVNTSESGSSRSLGSLHQNALNMAKYYNGVANPPKVVTEETSYPFTVDIERS